MPLFALAFGNYTDGFSAAEAMPEARKAAVKFVYLSAAVFVAFYLQAACWIRTGSRQASSMRIAFLQAVMRQDVAFFENQTSSGKPQALLWACLQSVPFHHNHSCFTFDVVWCSGEH